MHADVRQFGWYALQVTSRKEKQVASALTEKGFECFLPLYARRHIWSDRIKVTTVPLFCGYVFSRFDARSRLPIVTTPNVQAIVGHGKTPAQIAEPDLEAVRTVLENGLPIEPCEFLQEGDAVRVTKGPLAGVEGSFVHHKSNSRLVLSLSLIQRSVAVEIDRLYVEPLVRRNPSTDMRRTD